MRQGREYWESMIKRGYESRPKLSRHAAEGTLLLNWLRSYIADVATEKAEATDQRIPTETS
jgi:hypothetical protein